MTDPQHEEMTSRYVPGDWMLLAGQRSWLLLDQPTDDWTVPSCWPLVRDGADMDDILEAVLAGGLRSIAGFVLVGGSGGDGRVVVRGRATVDITNADGCVRSIAARNSQTWVDEVFQGDPAADIFVHTPQSTDGPELPLVSGIARACRVRIGGQLHPADSESVAEPVRATPLPAMAPQTINPPEISSPTLVLEVNKDLAAEPPVEAEPMEPPEAVASEPLNYDEMFQFSTRRSKLEPATKENLAQNATGSAQEDASVPIDAAAPSEDDQVSGPRTIDTAQWHTENSRPWKRLAPPSEEISVAPAPGEQPAVVDEKPAPAVPPDPIRSPVPAAPPDLIDSVPFVITMPKAPAPVASSPAPTLQQNAGPAAPGQIPPFFPVGPRPPAHVHAGLPPGTGASDDETATRSRAQIFASGGPTVLAVKCPANHLTSSVDVLCRVCQQPIPPQSPFEVPLPTLGVLRLSTGEVVTLDRGVVLGRSPSSNAEKDRPHLIKLASPSLDISRTHVSITIDGWHVLACDLGSVNGTVITRPDTAPERLRPHEAQVITPGTLVTLADELTIRFEATP